jgi:hypothetical protein
VKPRRTVLSNAVFRLSGGNEDNDLWVRKMEHEDGSALICSTWVPTDEERELIAAGANVELMVWGTGTPPVAMRLDDSPLGRPPEVPSE